MTCTTNNSLKLIPPPICSPVIPPLPPTTFDRLPNPNPTNFMSVIFRLKHDWRSPIHIPAIELVPSPRFILFRFLLPSKDE